ncbi:hypothetical protein JW868_03905, partial [Candidatus Woesearchaeota archaeon]|nr:hypothetical protein [Candidatus Woesearchaeota archaeon]
TGEIACQGHFIIEINGVRIKLDIDKNGNLQISETKDPFKEVYPDCTLESLLLRYDVPQIGVDIKRDQAGAHLYQALKSWESGLIGEVYVDEKLTDFSHSCAIVLASKQIEADREREYTFAQALPLNKKRLSYISGLHEVVRSELRRVEINSQ